MKKQNIIWLVALLTIFGGWSCSEDKLDSGTNFSTAPIARNEFDRWLLKNYTYPYNIDFQYRLKDIETSYTYNVVPADSAKTAKLAIITKYLWFDAYQEVVGDEFLKDSSPRVITTIGIGGFSGRGETVGSAEGGLKVTLYKVNSLDDATLKNYDTMTEYYFRTMHHEFTHILNQKKPYNTAFDQVTRDAYVNNDWINVNLPAANRAGFVSPYAMMNTGEDFAETFAYYVISTPKQWNDILQRAGSSGAAHITSKANLVKEYALSQWGLDLDKLRETVLRRGGQIATLDLEHLN